MTVAIVDTGLLKNVCQQADWLKQGVDRKQEPASVGHYQGHGTFIAGVVRSMAPAVNVKVFSLFKYGGAALESQLAPGLVAAFNSGADIISMSAGTSTAPGDVLLALQGFYENYLLGSNRILVCAAGNDASSGCIRSGKQGWPIAVGALDTNGARAGYSNFGPWVDVYARGSDMVNAYPNGPYSYDEAPMKGRPSAVFTKGLAQWSGTSFSTPLVAGILAARMTRYGQNAPQAWAALQQIAAARAAKSGGLWTVQPSDVV